MDIESVFDEQRAAFVMQPGAGVAERRARLKMLEDMLLAGAEEVCAAINADFGHRPAAETRILELFPSLEAIRHARRHVARWMTPERRHVSLWFRPATAEVRYQPLGVTGIIVPWNYPLYLAVGPLVCALAAGNRVMVKLSEYTPRFATLFAGLVAQTFPRHLVHVVLGDVDAARGFANLPFDHLLFTGSTSVGRQVMAAAARHLTPVTTASPDYTSIVNDRHFARLAALLDDARAQGARIEHLLEATATPLPRRLAPAVVLDVTDRMRIMREEIFGPLLPIVAYRTLDEAIRYVNERDRPLALYIFDDDRARRDDLLARTASGGVTINDTILHVGQDDLPFGGVGSSGLGRYHGAEGFRTFSQVRSVLRSHRLSPAALMYPPYGGALAKRLLKLMLRE